MSEKPGIGTLTETHLHAALKQWYAEPGDALEAKLEGYVVDILRGTAVLEVQTHNFGACRQKLRKLVVNHAVRLIHPIAQEKWIVRQNNPEGAVLARRKSPLRGRWEDVFTELVSCPDLLTQPNFVLEVVLVQEEEIRYPNTRKRRGRWKKDWRTGNRRLLKVLTHYTFSSPADFITRLPTALPQPFTNAHLAKAMALPTYLAQKMTYCLHAMGALERVGRLGRAWAYAVI